MDLERGERVERAKEVMVNISQKECEADWIGWGRRGQEEDKIIWASRLELRRSQERASPPISLNLEHTHTTP